MIEMNATRHRYLITVFAFAIQLMCVLFFVVEAVLELFVLEGTFAIGESETLETLVVFALVIGVVFTGRELYALYKTQSKLTSSLKVASGALAEVIIEYFDDWELTSSERDVALLAIKGCEISEIARIRDTREGTVKAQLNAIYRKADVSGRPQLISLFIEDMLDEGLISEKLSDV